MAEVVSFVEATKLFAIKCYYFSIAGLCVIVCYSLFSDLYFQTSLVPGTLCLAYPVSFNHNVVARMI